MIRNDQQIQSTGAAVQRAWRAPHGQLQDVAAIILAGTHRWHPDPLEDMFPRPLLPILSRPLIRHTLGWLSAAGISQVQICANGSTRSLRRALGPAGPGGMHLQYYEDTMPRGPAGCVKDAAMIMCAETFIVVEGTVMCRASLRQLLEVHRDSNALLTAAAVQCDDSAGAHLEPLGIYVIQRRALEQVAEFGYQDIKEALIPKLYSQADRVVKHVVGGDTLLRIQGWVSYHAACSRVVRQVISQQELPAGYRLTDGVAVHETAHVDPAAQIVGPVLIDRHASINARAIVVGPTTVGAHCTVGHHAVVTNSVLWDDCVLGEHSLTDHCVVTEGFHLRPHDSVRRAVCVSSALTDTNGRGASAAPGHDEIILLRADPLSASSRPTPVQGPPSIDEVQLLH